MAGADRPRRPRQRGYPRRDRELRAGAPAKPRALALTAPLRRWRRTPGSSSWPGVAVRRTAWLRSPMTRPSDEPAPLHGCAGRARALRGRGDHPSRTRAFARAPQDEGVKGKFALGTPYGTRVRTGDRRRDRGRAFRRAGGRRDRQPRAAPARRGYGHRPWRGKAPGPAIANSAGNFRAASLAMATPTLTVGLISRPGRRNASNSHRTRSAVCSAWVMEVSASRQPNSSPPSRPNSRPAAAKSRRDRRRPSTRGLRPGGPPCRRFP